MELNRRQFDLLEALAEAKGRLTQREISERTGHSLGGVNRTMQELKAQGLVDGRTVTKAGLDALEPYRVRRAVFIAAGFGSRLAPITLNTPKPLVRVHGVRIIDTLIDACLAAGIGEIWIVRGYLAEQFDQLLYKYPMIRFLENPFFNGDKGTVLLTHVLPVDCSAAARIGVRVNGRLRCHRDTTINKGLPERAVPVRFDLFVLLGFGQKRKQRLVQRFARVGRAAGHPARPRRPADRRRVNA